MDKNWEKGRRGRGEGEKGEGLLHCESKACPARCWDFARSFFCVRLYGNLCNDNLRNLGWHLNNSWLFD